VSEAKLTQIFAENSDEPHAATLARALMQARVRRPIVTTTALARLVRGMVSGDDGDASVRRVFQALRIAVNDEFGALDTFLCHLPECLAPGGRVAILTFHSGEDRRVKQAFKTGLRSGAYSAIAEEVQRASSDEVRANPRASSAKLRWACRA
jgi:16S rRNA (cytosine1402-N4)-methyltransferase